MPATTSWANVGSELQKLFPNTGWYPDLSEAGFWGGSQGLMAALDQGMQHLQAQEKADSTERIARINSGTEFDKGLMTLLQHAGLMPLEWAKLANARDVAELKKQWDVLEMFQRGQNQKEAAQIAAQGHVQGAKINADARRQAAEIAAQNKLPNAGRAPEMWVDSKAGEIMAEARKQGIIVPYHDARLQAEKEWEITRTADKLQLRQNPPVPNQAAPQKTSNASPDIPLSTLQILGLASPEDFAPTGNAASVQMVPGSFVPDTTPVPGTYRNSGETQAIKQAYPGLPPMYQNREIQADIVAGYQKPFQTAAQMDEQLPNPREIVGWKRVPSLARPGTYTEEPIYAHQINVPSLQRTEASQIDTTPMSQKIESALKSTPARDITTSPTGGAAALGPNRTMIDTRSVPARLRGLGYLPRESSPNNLPNLDETGKTTSPRDVLSWIMGPHGPEYVPSPQEQRAINYMREGGYPWPSTGDVAKMAMPGPTNVISPTMKLLGMGNSGFRQAPKLLGQGTEALALEGAQATPMLNAGNTAFRGTPGLLNPGDSAFRQGAKLLGSEMPPFYPGVTRVPPIDMRLLPPGTPRPPIQAPPFTAPKATGNIWAMGPQKQAQGLTPTFSQTNVSIEQALRDYLNSVYGL